jgi:hypothetical protein
MPAFIQKDRTSSLRCSRARSALQAQAERPLSGPYSPPVNDSPGRVCQACARPRLFQASLSVCPQCAFGQQHGCKISLVWRFCNALDPQTRVSKRSVWRVERQRLRHVFDPRKSSKCTREPTASYLPMPLRLRPRRRRKQCAARCPGVTPNPTRRSRTSCGPTHRTGT